MVEDRHRDLLKEMDQSSRGKTSAESGWKRVGVDEDASTESKGYGAYGLITSYKN